MNVKAIATATAVALTAGISGCVAAASDPGASASVTHPAPPSWVRWQYLTGDWRHVRDCENGGRPLGARPVVIWVRGSGSSVLACPPRPDGNGKILPS